MRANLKAVEIEAEPPVDEPAPSAAQQAMAAHDAFQRFAEEATTGFTTDLRRLAVQAVEIADMASRTPGRSIVAETARQVATALNLQADAMDRIRS